MRLAGVGEVDLVERGAPADEAVDPVPRVVVEQVGQHQQAEPRARQQADPLQRQARQRHQHEPAADEQDRVAEVRLRHQQHDENDQQDPASGVVGALTAPPDAGGPAIRAGLRVGRSGLRKGL